jgi:hypothetical protein
VERQVIFIMFVTWFKKYLLFAESSRGIGLDHLVSDSVWHWDTP